MGSSEGDVDGITPHAAQHSAILSDKCL